MIQTSIHRGSKPPDTPPDTPVNRRSLMVFSALAIDRWDDVMGLGADLVCFDLEDGTVAARKDEARQVCLSAFENSPTRKTALPSNGAAAASTRRLLRINSPRTVAGLKDLAAVAGLSRPPEALVLPKIGCAEDVRLVSDVLDDAGLASGLIPLIEDQAGVGNSRHIAAASPRVCGLFLGSVDLSGELGTDMGWDALYRARSMLVEAASEQCIDCIDGPWLDADDLDGLAHEAARLAAMGFTGKASYDPKQIPIIHAAFTPSANAIDYAERVVAAVANSASGGARVDGHSVNRANAKAARRVLDLARRRGVYLRT